MVGAIGTDGSWLVSGLRDAGVCVTDIVTVEEASWPEILRASALG